MAKTRRMPKKIDNKIDRIIIAEDKIKANLKRTICEQCGRAYFMALAKDGSTVQPCPVCLGVFEERKRIR